MGKGVPQPFKTKVVGPVTTKLEGLPEIPDTYHIHLEELPTIRIAVDELPKIRVGSDPIEIRLTEVPSTRTHLPADFTVGLSIMGYEIGAIRLCGEAQMITEPYRPNPCEICGAPENVPGIRAAAVDAARAGLVDAPEPPREG